MIDDKEYVCFRFGYLNNERFDCMTYDSYFFIRLRKNAAVHLVYDFKRSDESTVLSNGVDRYDTKLCRRSLSSYKSYRFKRERTPINY